MTEQLPISIRACDDLKQQYIKIASVCNKLEAQFNFQTMTANWYGDEDNILSLQLALETPQSLLEQQELLQTIDIQTHSDDVFSYYRKNQGQTLMCHIAITTTESALLEQQSKLLAGLLTVKLHKVLNLIAGQLNLDAI